MSKQYGLIIPKKEKGHTVQNMVTKPSIFDDDSDSDTNPAPMKPTGIGSSSLKKQDKINQERAMEEDPTVYQYDEIYDDMDQKRKESKLARKDIDKKPKYISRLLQTAERRKRENERRIERQVQKEREAEGEQFRDKESFVTSSYKKKLEEMKELEEQERREEYLESIGDVRKQGNLDGFYRHLYDQKVNFENDSEKNKVVEKDGSPSSKRKSADGSEEEQEKVKEPLENIKKRKYRQRQSSDSEHENEEENNLESDVKKEHLPCNLDADSDFSIESSDSEEEKDKKVNDKETVIAEVKKEDEVTKDEESKETPTEKKEIKEEIAKSEVKETKPKIDIWKKRTVGNVFDEALKRYFERKALRESGL